MYNFGINRRMARLFRENEGRTLIVPLDDSLTIGPKGSLAQPQNILNDIITAGVTAVLGFPGSVLASQPEAKLERIINVSFGSYPENYLYKIRGKFIELAINSDCVAVAHHVNFGNEYEPLMLKSLTETLWEAHLVGLPVMCIAYYRPKIEKTFDRSSHKKQENLRAEDIAKCVRVAAELGCDIIKTQMPSVNTKWENLINASMGVPLVLGGGDVEDFNKFSKKCNSALLNGYKGLCIGRNIYKRKNRILASEKLKRIIQNEN